MSFFSLKTKQTNKKRFSSFNFKTYLTEGLIKQLVVEPDVVHRLALGSLLLLLWLRLRLKLTLEGLRELHELLRLWL